MTTQAQSYANFDPIGDVRKDLESTQRQIESAFTADPSASSTGTPTAAAEAPPADSAVPAVPADPPVPPAPAADPVAHDVGGKPA